MKPKLKKHLPVMMIVLLACIVYLWRLWAEGFANLYYSAAVYSMGRSFHAFFYNSIDAVGFMSIDKPPLGFWIQVLFTKVLGFNGMAILLPEALAGVFSVYYLYHMMNRRFGQMAGIVSALILVFTPILAAVCRNNTIDGILIFMLILASDQLLQAVEKSSRRHLFWAGLWIGIGFNVKMLQAYMIVPAVYGTYVIFSQEKISKRIISTVISMVILLAVSFSWMMAVDLTPIQNRPYVGSSDTNREFNLALGNNGMERLLGRKLDEGKNNPLGKQDPAAPNGGGGQYRPPQEGSPPPPPPQDQPKNKPRKNPLGPPEVHRLNRLPGENPPQPPREISNNAEQPRAAQGEGGETSLFRLLNRNIAGQISWFLVPALLMSGLCLGQFFRQNKMDFPRNVTLFYFTLCFLSMFGYFSFSHGMTHRYYLAMLAPAIAGQVGIGAWFLKENFLPNKRIIVILLGISLAAQLYIQSLYKDWLTWLWPLCAVIFAWVIFIWYSKIKSKNEIGKSHLWWAILLILPGIWTFTPMIYGNNAQLPIAGPELTHQGDLFDRRPDLTSLITYLKENRGGATFIASAPSAMDIGAELILQSGEPVMILGGFNGKDLPITISEYQNMIYAGKVKYAIITEKNDPLDGEKLDQNINHWIIQNGLVVKRYQGFTLYQLVE